MRECPEKTGYFHPSAFLLLASSAAAQSDSDNIKGKRYYDQVCAKCHEVGSYGPVKRKVERTLKRALDPNGILSPGKSGIRI